MILFIPRGFIYNMWLRVTLYENKYGYYAYLTLTEVLYGHVALLTSRDFCLYYVEGNSLLTQSWLS